MLSCCAAIRGPPLGVLEVAPAGMGFIPTRNNAMNQSLHLTNDTAQMYLDYWLIAFAKLLGWSEDRTIDWARALEADLNDENSLLYRELPSHEASLQLLPAEFRSGQRTQPDPLRLASRLEDAFCMRDYSATALASYDWEAAAARIDSVLAEYGSSLDDVRRSYRCP